MKEISGSAYGVFYSETFERSSVLYNMMLEMIQKPHKAFKAQDSNLIAVLSKRKTLWFLVDENTGFSQTEALLDELCHTFAKTDMEGFASAPQLSLAFCDKMNAKNRNFFRVDSNTAYGCTAAKMPHVIRGRMRRATKLDKNEINLFMAGFFSEFYGESGKMIYSEYDMMRSNEFYVWEDRNEIVSMAALTCKSHGKARLNYVYTVPSQRNKGYATMLMGHLSRLFLNEGLVPVLYAKSSNGYANQLYLSSGFTDFGRIDVYADSGGKI